ncbi:MAG: OmpH family outer membrane protein [Candidatus Eisenbacteria bacterium]|nr:OmpH family outer membrane protein [Candidatus Eisenbacteria bacterium]
MKLNMMMICILAAGLLCMFAAPELQAADLKIAFIDSEKIFAAYKGTKEAQKAFNVDVQGWQNEADSRKREIELMRKELESQSLMLSEAKRQEKEAALQKKVSEYEGFVQSIWDPKTGKIAARNDELMKPIVEKVKAILDKIAEAEGYSMVIDAADGNIVYGVKDLDLTDRVIEELNKEG